MKAWTTMQRSIERLIQEGLFFYLSKSGALRWRFSRRLTPQERKAVAADRAEIIRLLQRDEEGGRWESLAASGLTDLDVIDLGQALFLFAVKKVTEPGSVIEELWKRYVPYWKKRLDPGAWDYISSLIEKACEPSRPGRVRTAVAQKGITSLTSSKEHRCEGTPGEVASDASPYELNEVIPLDGPPPIEWPESEIMPIDEPDLVISDAGPFFGKSAMWKRNGKGPKCP